MSKYQFEWPYIQYLTNKQRNEYSSDLPEDMDKLEVFHIVPTTLYHDNPYGLYESYTYITPEMAKENLSLWGNDAMWGCAYGAVLGYSLHSMTYWYNTNILENYKNFKGASWPGYFRLRFWPILATAWTVYHFTVAKTFSKYPKLI